MSQYPAPTGVIVRFHGPTGGSTTWYYWVQAVFPSGRSLLSAYGSAANGQSAIGGGSYNEVFWNSVPGAIGYNVFRATASTTPAMSPTGFIGFTSETGFKDDGVVFPSSTPSAVQYDNIYLAKAIYSFAVDGGAVGAITPNTSDTIPANAIVLGFAINSPTAVTSGGAATVAVGTTAGSAANSILTATGKASFTTDAVIVPTAVATPFKMTAAGQINITVAAAALTAGIIEIYVMYVVATNA